MHGRTFCSSRTISAAAVRRTSTRSSTTASRRSAGVWWPTSFVRRPVRRYCRRLSRRLLWRHVGRPERRARVRATATCRAAPARILDLTLARNFRLGGGRTAQVRIDAFNVFDTVVFNGPQRDALAQHADEPDDARVAVPGGRIARSGPPAAAGRGLWRGDRRGGAAIAPGAGSVHVLGLVLATVTPHRTRAALAALVRPSNQEVVMNACIGRSPIYLLVGAIAMARIGQAEQAGAAGQPPPQVAVPDPPGSDFLPRPPVTRQAPDAPAATVPAAARLPGRAGAGRSGHRRSGRRVL